ncbi:alkene reductase [Agarivorans sp. Toyoura001]|uniref:alkene reductase n=1 Tax=Agarivorans sp. Toyoura001 TaxID=2283141 RepID=UPI0010E71B30|nr:alkene reductase [Agarivorans sp. Toyoura001]GDY25503.1 alkene reductase [Agarivorans sp. Toyoura001]
MSLANLFSPINLGDISLKHRVVMAPLTRSRSAQPGDIPQALNVEYYQQRASAGLIITEATQVSPQGKGYAFTPGIHSEQQIQGWKAITDAVHAKGSKIVLQLWHVGRISHSAIQLNGGLPVAPSAIAPEGQAFTEQGFLDFETPRALESNEIASIVEQFKQAAINAKQAGFDGVEVHAANGYLLDQFLKDGTNQRSDNYGGSIENRARLTLEVTAAVAEVWGSGRVGVRISPTGTFNSMSDSKPQALFNHLTEQLSPMNLAYLHVVENFAGASNEGFSFAQIRSRFAGAYMANGGYGAESAEQAIANDSTDVVSFGAPFIANPDLPERFKQGADLNELDQDTLYGGSAKGYTDYPSLVTVSS